jgi:replicative DNA helicase
VARGGVLTIAIPAYNFDAECALLGAALVEGRAVVTRLARALTPTDFLLEQHRVIFRRLLAMEEAGASAAELTLLDALREAGELEEAGGPAKLAALCDGLVAALPAHVDDYVRIVLREAGKREQRQTLERALHQLQHGGDPGTVAAEVNEALTQIAERVDPVRTAPAGPIPVGTVLDALVASLDTPETDVIPFPIGEINERLGGGLRRAEVMALGGRPGTAKSALAIQCAVHAAGHGHATLVVSREMKNAALARRVLSQQAWIAALALRKRDLTDLEKARMRDHLPRLRGLPLWFDDSAVTIGQIRRVVRAGGYRLVIVDYLQLVRAPGIDNRRLEVSAVSAGLKDLAMRTGCSVLALSSLSRLPREKGKRQRPELDNLKESGDIEHDADAVLILHQPQEDSSDRELIFAKVREGVAGGAVRVAFQAQYVSFNELPEPGAGDVPF